MAARRRKKINLALQGGGALGAFTWGVLDKLLEDGRLEIEAISGASAGAMNAVVLCEGLEEGGVDGAREALRQFWESVADAGRNNPFRRTSVQRFLQASLGPYGEALTAPWRAWSAAIAGAMSPYDLGLTYLNPLEELIEELVDFDRVRRCSRIALYIAATNVRSGKARIFTNPELTARHVVASACLPQMFQAVEIDGEAYWDGGYMGNPPLFPLYDQPRSHDILIVQVNPIDRPEIPRTVEEITGRINEVTFNASLLRELRAIEFVSRLLEEGRLEEGRYRRMLLHIVSDDPHLVILDPASKLNTDLDFMEQVFGYGRASGEAWLDKNYEAVGQRSTIDLRAMFDGDVGPPDTAERGRAKPGSPNGNERVKE